MNSIFQNNYESENDKRLDKKFSYNYQVIKRMYPKASELPEEEVRGIIQKYYQAPKGQEEQVIKDYISQKEPEWHQLYGLDYKDKEEVKDANSFWQSTQNNDFWGGYGNRQNTSSSTIQPMTEQEHQKAKTLASQIRPEIPNTYTDYLAQNTADMVYGAGRALNGLTGGGLDYLGDRYGIDTRMEDYLDFKDEEGTGNLTRQLGNMAQLGGLGMSAYSLGRTGTNVIRPHYNSWQIGRAYDRLSKNPYQGSGQDVIARMKNHNGETVLLQRGEAIPGQNGEVITSGRPLQHEYGTARNYGLNKAIYKHNVSKPEAQSLPKYIRQTPVDISPRGQDIYVTMTPEGKMQTVTTPINGQRTISSFYKFDK